MNDTARNLKTAAMFVAIPRYVGLFLFLSGFVFEGYVLTALHVMEGVAGLSLAVLEGFALSYILSRRQLGFSRTDKRMLLFVVVVLLVLLPVGVAPYLLFLFDGTNVFAQSVSAAAIVAQASAPWGWKFVWAAAVASMNIWVIVGVSLVEKDPVDVQIMRAQREAELEQTLSRIRAETQQAVSRIEAETEQTLLQYRLQAQQARAEHRAEKQHIETRAEQSMSNPFVCDRCGRGFESSKALAGHKGHCKAKAGGEQNGELAEQEVSHA